MSSPIRLYIDQPLNSDAGVVFGDGQAHYLRNVMRRVEGDEVRVFNSRDGEYSATITNLGKKGGAAALSEQVRAPETEPDLWLFFAPIKRGPVEMIVQKATELGVSVFSPVQTERTNAARLNVDRLAAIAVEAAEQCERLSVPEMCDVAKLKTVLADWPEDRVLIYCDEAGDHPTEQWGGKDGRAQPMLEALAVKKAEKSTILPATKGAILIGPEGGFSSDERAVLREKSFVIPVTLGPRILRADTAAIAAVAVWQAAQGGFRER